MKVLIENVLGEIQAEKCSPDGKLQEEASPGEKAIKVVYKLRKKGIDAERIVKESVDVPLNERVRRVNQECAKYGASNVLLISIHCNAAGNGSSWMNARGWSAHVSLNASLKSKLFAKDLIAAADTEGFRVRKYSPVVPYWEQNLAICRDTKCPAILTESFFMDNKEDVDFLLSDAGKRAITKVHVNGILKYLS